MTERDRRRSLKLSDELEVWPVVRRKTNRDKVSDRYLAKRRRRNASTGTAKAWRELFQAIDELRKDVDG
jgi:hypothetical protein